MIMNYEKRYNELIDAIKEMMEANPHDEGLQNWVHDNVPELTESEDERIRKTLIRFHKSTIDIDESNERADKWDGVKKEPKNVEDEPKNYKQQVMSEMTDLVKVYIKQKPSWSEEDEKNLQGIIDEIEADKDEAPSYDLTTYDKYLNWLKSLRNKII